MHKTLKKRIIWISIIIFVCINLIAIFHAYKFTHFSSDRVERTKNPKDLSSVEKIKALLFGVTNPRPENDSLPSLPFEKISLNSNKEIECWFIKAERPKATVILFHGFAGSKSGMLDKANVFHDMGYNTLLVDFMGSGGSEGNQTTVGFLEAEQVKTCFDYLTEKGEKHIYLLGTSMGAAAIMKAMKDYRLRPDGIMLECPFGTMYKTVCARFHSMNAPVFPMASLLVFWGGIENGFWAFGHNPEEYAKYISCPVLLMYGAKDERVSREEIDSIYAHLHGKKELKVYENAGHENYLKKNRKEWVKDIGMFMSDDRAYHDLISDFIENTKSPLVTASRKDESINFIFFYFDRIEKSDSAIYNVYQVGHNVFDENGENKRFVTDAWVYIDINKNKLFEFDMSANVLIDR
jgi:alpha-beta hydrolase superfamily lysophospholipase